DNPLVVVQLFELDYGVRAIHHHLPTENITSFCFFTGTECAAPNAITTATIGSILFVDFCLDSQALSHLSFSTTADMIAEMSAGLRRNRTRPSSIASSRSRREPGNHKPSACLPSRFADSIISSVGFAFFVPPWGC